MGIEPLQSADILLGICDKAHFPHENCMAVPRFSMKAHLQRYEPVDILHYYHILTGEFTINSSIPMIMWGIWSIAKLVSD